MRLANDPGMQQEDEHPTAGLPASRSSTVKWSITASANSVALWWRSQMKAASLRSWAYGSAWSRRVSVRSR